MKIDIKKDYMLIDWVIKRYKAFSLLENKIIIYWEDRTEILYREDTSIIYKWHQKIKNGKLTTHYKRFKNKVKVNWKIYTYNKNEKPNP